MAINPIANNAYGFVQKALNNASESGGTSGSSGTGSGFGDMVAEGLKGAINNVRASERVSEKAVLGNASLADVVQAVNGADVALKSVVAIRDRVIGAYQDIIKMPI